MSMILRGQVYWVNLDPTVGTETKKTRPALIISNNFQNKLDKRFIIAPITSTVDRVYPFEATVYINGNKNKAMLDQLRTVDRSRVGKLVASLSQEEMHDVERALKLVLAL